MKVICLVENTEGCAHCPVEHGLCYYIETNGHKILMDTGADDLLLKNAEQLGVDLTAVDIVVLSHGHYDHGGGLLSFLAVNHTASVYLQKTAFEPYYSIHKDGPKYIGLDKALKDHPQLIELAGSSKISDTLTILADIPVHYSIPSANERLKKKTEEEYVPDLFDHEQCLVIQEGSRSYLFSGCAHHGIQNIMKTYETQYSSEPYAVFSGFHMMKKNYTDEDMILITDTAFWLKLYHSLYYTGHCTGNGPYEVMKKILGDQLTYLHCGDRVEFTTS